MRVPRYELASEIVHVTSRGNNRREIFSRDEDYRSFLALLERSARKYDWVVYSYCLMRNHVHLVVRAPQEALSNGLRDLIGGYARTWNKRLGRKNHAFGDRFHGEAVLTDWQLVNTCRYVLRNPVRCKEPLPLEYRWSSYRANCGLAPAPPFLAVRELLGIFGNDPRRAAAAFRAFIAEGL